VYDRGLKKAAYLAEIGCAITDQQQRGTPPMNQGTVVQFRTPGAIEDGLTELLRNGAKQLIQQAVEAELAELLEQHSHRRDEQGRAAVVRNGYLPEREIVTGVGPVAVRVPKVQP
jgi:putative transposase